MSAFIAGFAVGAFVFGLWFYCIGFNDGVKSDS